MICIKNPGTLVAHLDRLGANGLIPAAPHLRTPEMGGTAEALMTKRVGGLPLPGSMWNTWVGWRGGEW